MKTIKVKGYEPVEDENGIRMVEFIEEQEIDETRHAEVCMICNMSIYPECIAKCPHFKEKAEPIRDEDLDVMI